MLHVAVSMNLHGVDDMTDNQFNFALRRVHQYLRMNPLQRRRFSLEANRGPRNATERFAIEAHYVGQSLRRFAFFDRSIFTHLMYQFNQFDTISRTHSTMTLSELQFDLILQKTNLILRHYSLRKGILHFQKYKGPQCWSQLGYEHRFNFSFLLNPRKSDCGRLPKYLQRPDVQNLADVRSRAKCFFRQTYIRRNPAKLISETIPHALKKRTAPAPIGDDSDKNRQPVSIQKQQEEAEAVDSREKPEKEFTEHSQKRRKILPVHVEQKVAEIAKSSHERCMEQFRLECARSPIKRCTKDDPNPIPIHGRPRLIGSEVHCSNHHKLHEYPISFLIQRKYISHYDQDEARMCNACGWTSPLHGVFEETKGWLCALDNFIYCDSCIQTCRRNRHYATKPPQDDFLEDDDPSVHDYTRELVDLEVEDKVKEDYSKSSSYPIVDFALRDTVQARWPTYARHIFTAASFDEIQRDKRVQTALTEVNDVFDSNCRAKIREIIYAYYRESIVKRSFVEEILPSSQFSMSEQTSLTRLKRERDADKSTHTDNVPDKKQKVPINSLPHKTFPYFPRKPKNWSMYDVALSAALESTPLPLTQMQVLDDSVDIASDSSSDDVAVDIDMNDDIWGEYEFLPLSPGIVNVLDNTFDQLWPEANQSIFTKMTFNDIIQHTAVQEALYTSDDLFGRKHRAHIRSTVFCERNNSIVMKSFLQEKHMLKTVAVAIRPTRQDPPRPRFEELAPRPYVNLGSSSFINASILAMFGPVCVRTALENDIQIERLHLEKSHDIHLKRNWMRIAKSITGTEREDPDSIQAQAKYTDGNDPKRLIYSLWASLLPASSQHEDTRQEITVLKRNSEGKLTFVKEFTEPLPVKGHNPWLFIHKYYHGKEEDALHFL